MTEDSKQIKPGASPNYDLASISLQIGTRVQLITEQTSQSRRYFAVLIGYLTGAAVLVRTPTEGTLTVPFKEGEPLTVRVFAGVHVYSFRTVVERVQLIPFPCLYLRYPREVSGVAIRKAMRAQIEIPAQATAATAGDETPQTSPVSLSNLSASGGLVQSETKLGNVQDEIGISFAFVARPGEPEVQISTRATIRNLSEPKPSSPQQPARYAHGVEFVGLDPTEQALLQILVYESVVGLRQPAA